MQVLNPKQHARDASKHHVTELLNMNWPMQGSIDWEAMLFGNVWEYVSSKWVGQVAWQAIGDGIGQKLVYQYAPEPVERDGIVGSVDGLIYQVEDESTPVPVVLVEQKLRYTTKQEDPRDNPRYYHQVRAYCYMTGCREVWMPVMYLGTRPPDVKAVMYRFQVSDQECNETWTMLMNLKRYSESGGGVSSD